MIAYKFLAPGAVAPFTGFPWPVAEGGPGPWVEAADERADLGIHACRPCDLPYWLDAELWRAELAAPVGEGQRQVVAKRGRLLERVQAWGPEAAAQFAQEAALMARDRVAAALRRAAFDEEAEGLARCSDLRGLLAAAKAVTSPGVPSSLAAYLAEAAETALAGDVPVSAYISARAAVPCSGGDEREFAAERARQARWLAERLGLPAVTPLHGP
jgi:hypothetical protein